MERDAQRNSANGGRSRLAFGLTIATWLAACGGGEGVVEGASSTPVAGSGVATVSWVPPIANEDGSALTNLAGFRIYFGSSATSLDRIVQVGNPGATSHVINALAPGTYFFGVRAYSTTGAESNLSALVSKSIP